jgi:cytochrome c oxidase subunit 2
MDTTPFRLFVLAICMGMPGGCRETPAAAGATSNDSMALSGGLSPRPSRVIQISAKRFEFNPSSIQLKLGEPVILELTSLDREHGFSAPDLALEADIRPGEPTRIAFTPKKVGTFPFHCDIFCGDGHEDMSGLLVVRE